MHKKWGEGVGYIWHSAIRIIVVAAMVWSGGRGRGWGGLNRSVPIQSLLLVTVL